jgi:hypothetical protein
MTSQGKAMSDFVPTGKHDPACPDCKGSGERDSGGTHPWGAPAMMPCDCDRQPKNDPTLPKHDLHWYAEKCGVSVEQIRLDLGLPPDDAIRRNSVGCAALDDIISHSKELQSAFKARVRLAQSEDRNAVKAMEEVHEPWEGPRDAYESFWKRESAVIDRIIHQARFARGRETS